MGLSEARVFLTGFMGCGKSTLGPLVADTLHLQFADLDDVIEARAGRSIATIFEQHGEAFFRSLEADALRTTERGCVHALGGGTLASEKNLRWALAHGLVVYLDVPDVELVRRLKADSVARPLLMDMDGRRLSSKMLEQRIQILMQKRGPFYRRAHIVLPSVKPPSGLVHEAVQAIRHYNLTDLR